MLKFRPARLQDTEQIQDIEKEYYEGFACPKDTLKNWVQNLSENFIVAEEDGRTVGFIFFEYLDGIKAVPFVHTLEHTSGGKYVYVSEVGILDRFQKSDVLQGLFDKLIEKSRKDCCETVVWVTGSKSKHDKIESDFLLNNGFAKKEKIDHWEAYPRRFVSDHFIWVRKI